MPFGYESFVQFKLSAPSTIRIDIDDVVVNDWAILALYAILRIISRLWDVQ